MKKEVNSYNFKKFNPIGKEEKKAACDVINNGLLSGFLAGTSDEFYGGKYVKKFEKKIKSYFGVKYAITVNSWTSGLVLAVKAIGAKENDEIIIPTWTMSACLVAVLESGATPVLCDIDINDYTIDVTKIKKLISKKTVAIMAVDLFGAPCNYKELFKIAKKYKIKIISDSAQAIGAKYNKRYLSTFVDVGGFSLNRHKHINTGEGGIILTNNKKYARKIYLLRNHAESSLNKIEVKKNEQIYGFNYRLGEIEAAIGICQLKKLKFIINKRRKLMNILAKKISNLTGLIIPSKKYLQNSIFYFFPFNIDEEKILTKKKIILKKFKNLGMKGITGDYSTLHKLNVSKKFLKKRSFNNAEKLLKYKFFAFKVCLYDLNENDISLIANIFKKIWKSLNFKNENRI